MSNPLFSIRNLLCSYDGQKPVLKIEELDIPSGELVFLLGVSGAGKSTLIETLALMNDTIEKGLVEFTADKKLVEVGQLWKNNNQEKIAELRKKHFSFIFQETNLMENFTAYENVCLAQMIKEGVRQKEAIQEAKQLAQQIGLGDNELNSKTNAANLSGGQRQRLAFVRAINNDFSVIFGDEPTGNLDEANANELIRILKNNLKESSSAIFVSHDIDLALRHADRIIIITKPEGGCGEIVPSNIYTPENWKNNHRAFRQKLADLYQIDKPIDKVETDKENIENSTYSSLFLHKEGKALEGKKAINFWLLTIMLAFTFLVIGFANGSLVYLDKKMNNAFVKWMDISIPWGESTRVSQVKDRLAKADLKKEFDYENVSAYVRYAFPFWTTDGKIIKAKGRSVLLEKGYNPLVEELLKDKNLISGDANFTGNEDLSLIVTKRFLEDIGLDTEATFVNMLYKSYGDDNQQYERLKVPIPIRAVVKEIPGKSTIMYTMNFYETATLINNSTLDLMKSRNIHVFAPGSKEQAEKIQQSIDAFLKKHPKYGELEPRCEIKNVHEISYGDGFDLEISFYPPQYGIETNKIWQTVQEELPALNDNLQRIYYYKAEDLNPRTAYDRISLYFKDLQKIRPFADTLYSNPKRLNVSRPIEVDITQIIEKENFDFLSRITKIVAFLLVGFGLISISLFVFNLLKMHLSKVQRNIGTLKAFGLGNKEAQSIYFNIIVRFLLKSLVLGLLITCLTGYGIDLILQLKMNTVEQIAYFRLIHLNSIVALILIIVVVLWVSRFTIRRILSKSPGDLIYGR